MSLARDQATQTAELGDRVQFAGTARSLLTANLTMSSWGCQSGNWFSSDCVTAPGATFSHPITLNIFSVGVGNAPATLLRSVTQTFVIPYRPSADLVNCTGGRWREASTGNCYNGYAVNITFNLAGLNVPNQVIYGIAYNTSGYGSSPFGYATACALTAQGCGYDSLNVGYADAAPTVGADAAPADAYYSSTFGSNYCDGGLGGTGSFRLDAGCWAGYTPAIKFNAARPVSNKDQCKDGGWQTYTRTDGSTFKNQGDCVSYTANGK